MPTFFISETKCWAFSHYLAIKVRTLAEDLKKKAQKRQATLTLINVKENLQTLLLCLKKCNISFSVQTGQGTVTAATTVGDSLTSLMMAHLGWHTLLPSHVIACNLLYRTHP